MSGEVIKSFLVGLGFGVDDGELAKFNKAIASASLKVAALYGTIQAASAGIVAGISDISEGFEKMGYEYHIIAPAINKALVLRRELLKAYSSAGINITKVIQASVKLNMSLAKTKFAFEAIYKSVGSRFFGLLTKQSDQLRQKIYQNMPKIQHALESFVKGIFKAFEATTILGLRLWSILERVFDFFVKLDKATNGWSTIILGVVAAWKLLNLEFIATPLGLIITGLVAILALFDDFKTFQEGGKSLFNWGPAIPVIEAVERAISSLYDSLSSLVAILFDLALGFKQLFTGDFSGALDSLKRVGADILAIFTNLWEAIKGIGNAASGIGGILGDKFGSLFGGGNAAANLVGPVQPQPMVGNSAYTNQHVQQQTQINVTGSADANAVGKAVAGEQNRVNFDMTRNMRGATR
jgi:hypothetical protein